MKRKLLFLTICLVHNWNLLAQTLDIKEVWVYEVARLPEYTISQQSIELQNQKMAKFNLEEKMLICYRKKLKI